MKKKLNKISILTSLMVLMNVPNVMALDLVPVGIGTIAMNPVSTVTGVTFNGGSVDMTFGGGLLFYQNVAPMWSLSTGFVYMGISQSYNLSVPAAGATINATGSIQVFRIPLLAHYEIAPGFKIGLGLFYDHGIGNVTTNQTLTVAGSSVTTTVDRSWDVQGMNQDYMGLMLAGDYTTPISSMMDFFSSIRIGYGLTDMEKSTNSLNLTTGQVFSSMHQFDVNLYLGLRFASLL